MNVIAINQYGCNYLCEFRNDSDKINEIVNASPRKPEVEKLREKFEKDLQDESWNNSIAVVLDILRDAGCNVVWDR
jgi:hypothetical protein